MAAVLHEIKNELKSPHSCLNDLPGDNVQQVKQEIRSAINNCIHQLRVREQFLLQQAESVHECFSQLGNANIEKAAEARGKLQCCADIAHSTSLKDDTNLAAYASKALQAYKDLAHPDKNSGTVTFSGNEEELIAAIRKFGKVTSTAMHTDDDGSDVSWEFAESETMSTTSEQNPDFKENCANGCGAFCSNQQFEIEDVNRYFENHVVQPVLSVSDVCKAQKECSSFKECICYPPCCSSADRSNAFQNPFVNKIQTAIQGIALVQPVSESFSAESKVENTLGSFSSNLDEFNQHIASLQEEFSRIMSGESPSLKPEPEKTGCDNKGFVAVKAVSERMAEILDSRNESNDASFPVSLPSVMSEIQAIVDGEVPLYGLDSSTDPVESELSRKMKHLMQQHKSSTAEIISNNPSAELKNKMFIEKAEDNKVTSETADEKIKKNQSPVSVEDMHDILTGILNA